MGFLIRSISTALVISCELKLQNVRAEIGFPYCALLR